MSAASDPRAGFRSLVMPVKGVGLLLTVLPFGLLSVVSIGHLCAKWQPIDRRSDVLLSDPGAQAYHYDESRTFIQWEDRWFNIARQESIVVGLPDRSGRFLGRTWWHRGSHVGVIVGDGVKDHERNCHLFKGRDVFIRDRGAVLKVTFPNEVTTRPAAGTREPWTCPPGIAS